jgi:hypothetical protein
MTINLTEKFPLVTIKTIIPTSLQRQDNNFKYEQLRFCYCRLWRYVESIGYLEEINRKLLADISSLKKSLLANTCIEQQDTALRSEELQFMRSVDEYKLKIYELNLELASNFAKINALRSRNGNLVNEKDQVLERISSINTALSVNNNYLRKLLKSLGEFNKKLDLEKQIQNEFYDSIESLQVDVLYQCLVNEEIDRIKPVLIDGKVCFDCDVLKECLRRAKESVKVELGVRLVQNRDELLKCYAENLKKIVAKTNQSHLLDSTTAVEIILAKYSDAIIREKSYNKILSARSFSLAQQLKKIRDNKVKMGTKYDSVVNYLKSCVSDQLEVMGLEKNTLESEIKLYKQLIDLNKKSHRFSNVNQIQNRSKTYGPVGIREISIDFMCVVLENQDERDEYDLSKWELNQRVGDKGDEINAFVLPIGASIGPKSKLCVWSSSVPGVTEDLTSSLIVRGVTQWAKNSVVETRLFDEEHKLRSTLVQNIEFK